MGQSCRIIGCNRRICHCRTYIRPILSNSRLPSKTTIGQDDLIEFWSAGIRNDITAQDFYAAQGQINAVTYGADPTGATDSTAAIEAAVTAAAVANAEGEGGQVVFLPYGLYEISSTLTIPNKVRLAGVSARGSILKAAAAFTGTHMIEFVNGTSAMFDTGVSRMTVNCNSVSSLSGIKHNAPHENTEFDNILVSNFDTYGLEIANAYEGASHFLMTNTEFAPDTGATSIYHYPGDSFATEIVISGMTLHGDATASKGIHVKGQYARVIATGLHIEKCTDGVYIEGANAGVVLIGTRGQSTVVSLVKNADGGNNRRLRMIHCDKLSGTNFFTDGTYTETANIADFRQPWYQSFSDDATPSVGNRATTIRLSGTTTITAFDDAVEGQEWFVRFNGIMSIDLSANASLVGNGGSDFTTAVGDGMLCRHDNGVTYCFIANKA